MKRLAGPITVVAVLFFMLALPPAAKEKNCENFLKRFFAAAMVSIFGILLPLFVFFASVLLMPDSKAACRHGWLDCFHEGKLALTPLVLWASAALYALDACRVTPPRRSWIVSGVVAGALSSTVCLAFGVVSAGSGAGLVWLWLLVPLYVSAWYSFRSVQLVFNGKELLWPVCGTLPFWLGSFLWSRSLYSALPESSRCFVASAAARGHRRLVGPFRDVTHRGRRQQANRQLLVLWRFEDVWRSHAPWSHAAFRRVYNRVGPGVAERITSPWAADLVYLALKPAELGAALLFATTRFHPMSGHSGVSPHEQSVSIAVEPGETRESGEKFYEIGEARFKT